MNNTMTTKIRWQTLIIAAVALVLTAGCGGGGGTTGGGGGGTNTQTFYLTVTTPATDGKIYTSSTITVSGETTSGSTVTVNGLSATVASDGSFTRTGVPISTTSNPTSVSVLATDGSTSYTVTRAVYYQNTSLCNLVYAKRDPRTGYDRIYDKDVTISTSERMLNEDTLGAAYHDPSVSPDRSKVAYIRTLSGTQSLMVRSCAATGSETALVSGAHYLSPAWSKDGTLIAYAGDASGNYDIYVVGATGGSSTQITTHGAMDDSPTFLADDSEIVFSSTRDTGGGASVGERSNLWRVEVTPPRSPALLYDPTAGQGPTCPDGNGNCSSYYPDLNANNELVFQFEYSCSAYAGTPDHPDGTCNEIQYLSMTTPTSITSTTSGGNNFRRPRWYTSNTEIIVLKLDSTVDKGTSSARIFITNGAATGSQSAVSDCSSPDW